jgi:5'-3' exonuclease
MTSLIVDSSYLIYRSYFAYPNLKVDNKPVGAFFGFVKAIIAAKENFEIDQLIFAFDLPEPTWRHKLLDSYKLGRTPAESDMIAQIPMIKNWCKLVTKNAFENSNFEADDIVFTICQQLPKDSQILILSADKDLYQLLINPKVSFLQAQKMGKYSLFKHENLFEKYGVNPQQWIDYKALIGDNSDNLKGISGIGPKTAGKILQNYGSLKNLLKDDFFTHKTFEGDQNIQQKPLNQTKIDQKWLDKIVENKEILKQTYELSTLQNVKNIKFEPTGFDLNKSLEIFSELKFQSLISKIQQKPKPILNQLNLNNEQTQENLF